VTDPRDVASLLLGRAEAHGDAACMIWSPFDDPAVTFSYLDVLSASVSCAAGLLHRGVSAGDRVVIVMRNRPEFVFSFLGCALIGAVAVPVNIRLVGAEMARIISLADPVGAIADTEALDALQLASPGLGWVLVAEEAPRWQPPGIARACLLRTESITELCLAGHVATLPARPAPSAPLCIQYTSGTSGTPKGVLWTHANGAFTARVSARHEGLTAADRHLTHLPLFHTNALAYSLLASLWAGAAVVLQPGFSASRFWDTARQHGCTWSSMSSFALRVLPSPDPAEHGFRMWGAPAADPVAESRFGIPILSWWGMTETVTHCVVGAPAGRTVPGSMGVPVPPYELRIRNEEGIQAISEGVTGELLVRGQRGVSLFAHYVDDAEATAAAFDDEGFLLTGDKVEVVGHGCIRFVERIKDIIRVGGENVSCAEVEAAVGGVPGILEVAAVGQEHPTLGEVPVVFVVSGPGSDQAAIQSSINDACETQLADFKRPRSVRFVAELPRVTLGKVSRAALRQSLRGPAVGSGS
jgi:crotonobetaine/carnitine-CoA ligase